MKMIEERRKQQAPIPFKNRRNIQIPKQLQREEFRFILLNGYTKKPLEQKWTTINNYKFNDPKLLEHIKDNNYGVLCGPGQLAVLDIDDINIIPKIEEVLPDTFTVETGSGKRHYYYIVAKDTQKVVFNKGKNGDSTHYGELQFEGSQCVAPGSTHPSSKRFYRVIRDVTIAELPTTKINTLKSLYSDNDYTTKNITTRGNNFTSKIESDIENQLSITNIFSVTNLKPSRDEYYGEHPTHGSTGGMNFFINPEKNLWHCFRCDSGGGVAMAIALKENIITCEQAKGPLSKENFKRVLKIAEDKYGYKIEKIMGVGTEYLKLSTLEFSNMILTHLVKRERPFATEKLTRKILSENYIYTTRNDEKSEMWMYREGIYVPNGKTYIREFCRDILKETYTTELVNDVINKIETETYINQEDFFAQGDIFKIVVKNGVLNIITSELEGFSPKYRFFSKLPVFYDKEKKCETIIKFFESVVKDKRDISVLQEVFGYLLYRDYKFEKCFMLLGKGRNGKSKTIELMKRFIGIENCTNISLQEMEENTFATGELFNKWANLSPDLDKTALRSSSKLRELTGHDMISASRKFLNKVSFVNFAKMIFCTNELPWVYDNNFAFYERWVILDFPYTFIPKYEIEKMKDVKNVREADSEIIDKVTTDEELSGLLNWSLVGLKRLLEKKEFSSSSTAEEIQTIWQRNSNNVVAFIKDCFDEEFGARITKSDFRQYYTEYCKVLKLKPISDKHVKTTLETEFGLFDSYNHTPEGDQVWNWNGVKFNKNRFDLIVNSSNNTSSN